MIKTNVREARQNFSYLLNQVEKGEEVLILRRHQIVAHIIPHTHKKSLKTLPSLKAFRAEQKTKGKSLSKMIMEEREKR